VLGASEVWGEFDLLSPLRACWERGAGWASVGACGEGVRGRRTSSRRMCCGAREVGGGFNLLPPLRARWETGPFLFHFFLHAG
jgi:hypothetical protein